MRRIALNTAQREPSNSAVRGKIERAAWNDEFFLYLIRVAA